MNPEIPVNNLNEAGTLEGPVRLGPYKPVADPPRRGAQMSTSTSPGTVPPPVLGLDNQISSDPSVVGAKAAALAVARRAGLPVLDGFVIPVGGAADVAGASASQLP